MSDRQFAGPGDSLSDTQETQLQLVGYVSSSLSLTGSLYVLLYFTHVYWRCTPQLPRVIQHRASRRARTDFMDKLVVVLALFDLVAIAARAVGRSVVHDVALCNTQAALLQTATLASCLWICCTAFNLYRWIVGGESDATRQRRFPVFVAIAVIPGAALAAFHVLTNKYGDATFYCWLDEIRYMFFSFYVFYLLMVVFNLVLLALIHLNIKQRVARHDTVEADTSSMLIRRKLVLHIVVFIAHRTPMMIYRMFEAGGMVNFKVGLTVQVIQDLNGLSNAIVYGGMCRRYAKKDIQLRDGDAISLPSPTESMMGGLRVKKSSAIMEDDQETMFRPSASIGTATVRSGFIVPCESDSEDSSADRSTYPCKSKVLSQKGYSYSYRDWHQRLLKHFSLHHALPPGGFDCDTPFEPKKIAIFASTFNMGEKDVLDSELRQWIPLRKDVYVFGVQECMNLADLQMKILRHLLSGSSSKYVHYSREIGKRATALGYHGYIALCIFVRSSAVASGRFRIIHGQRRNRNAQEVFRGKSLLLFGRASNKGAVGMSFRFDGTSFAFVTCHLASDSSSLTRAKRKKDHTTILEASDSLLEASMENDNGRSSGGDCSSKASISNGATVKVHQPPSKVERRNRDAMEILQQLYLDEEDYGFGFSHLHHHSFILGDFNYRMTRKGATPMDMLKLLVNAGIERYQTCEDTHALVLSSPCYSPSISHASVCELSGHNDEAGFRHCMTPKARSLARISSTRVTVRERVGAFPRKGHSSSVPFQLQSLVEEHDELSHLCRSQQLFHGFQEKAITFFPTFRRIRGQTLRKPLDALMLQQNYSLVAAHGGYRVPSYTDRIFYSSLAGTQNALHCLSYDSCELVTSSDHKPVSACFEVALLASAQKPFVPSRMADDSAWFGNSTDTKATVFHPNPLASAMAAARMEDIRGACELRLRIEFRSIHWTDTLDSALFDRAEHVQFGFLFPLPCEDVFAPQRKLHEVAEQLTFGGADTVDADFASTVTPISNFHTLKWHEFVNGGLRYHTMAGAAGHKHVAVILRGRRRTVPRSAPGSCLMGGGSCSQLLHSSSTSLVSSHSSAALHNGVISSASFSSEQLFGHGTFCAEDMMKKRDVCVPLTLGGRLLGRLQLRVSLQLRQK
uniref:G-protein coupled receptors family 1 profile domain-containing protein n=1 Tax=Peronospora matthiolae TaxID=2874970 RepID=A0AAV1T051_9STRA